MLHCRSAQEGSIFVRFQMAASRDGVLPGTLPSFDNPTRVAIMPDWPHPEGQEPAKPIMNPRGILGGVVEMQMVMAKNEFTSRGQAMAYSASQLREVRRRKIIQNFSSDHAVEHLARQTFRQFAMLHNRVGSLFQTFCCEGNCGGRSVTGDEPQRSARQHDRIGSVAACQFQRTPGHTRAECMPDRYSLVGFVPDYERPPGIAIAGELLFKAFDRDRLAHWRRKVSAGRARRRRSSGLSENPSGSSLIMPSCDR